MNDRLYAGAGIVGLVLAVVSALGAPRPDALGLGAAAVVNGRAIPKQAVARAVEALESDKRNLVTKQDADAALERLIDEELLVQRGAALDLAETDLGARKALVQSVLQLAVAERAGREPDDATLRTFYAENAGFFTPTARVAASLVYVAPGPGMDARAQSAEAALRRGADAAKLGDPQALVLPKGPLGATELHTYLGDSLAKDALRAAAGDVIVRSGVDGVRLLRIEKKVLPVQVRFEDVEPQVRTEWSRRADEAAVRAYVDRLKRRARITRAS